MFPDNVNREQSLRKILACETTALLLELQNVVSATFMVARPLRVDLQRDRISLRTNGKAGYASCNESSFPRVRLHVICLAAVIVSCKRSRNRIALVSPIDEVFVAEFFCQSAPKIKLRYWHTGCSSIAVDARTQSSEERKQDEDRGFGRVG